MANEKISAMPAPSLPLGGTELFPLVQSAANDAIAFSDLVAQIGLAGAFITGAQVPENEADPIFNAWLIATPPLISGSTMNFDGGLITSTGSGGTNFNGFSSEGPSHVFNGASGSCFHFEDAAGRIFADGLLGIGVLSWNGVVSFGQSAPAVWAANGDFEFYQEGNGAAAFFIACNSTGKPPINVVASDLTTSIFSVDSSGNLVAESLSAGNGFTGTGAFTNFTISGGIITAAS